MNEFCELHTSDVAIDASGCRMRNGGCQHLCVNGYSGRHSCRCNAGFKLSEDGRTCEGRALRGIEISTNVYHIFLYYVSLLLSRTRIFLTFNFCLVLSWIHSQNFASKTWKNKEFCKTEPVSILVLLRWMQKAQTQYWYVQPIWNNRDGTTTLHTRRIYI